MLKKFTVSGYQCFNEQLTFELGGVLGGLGFKDDWVSKHLVKTGLVLGNAGAGKTTLGFAMLDLARHLTDNQSTSIATLGSIEVDSEDLVELSYHFQFDWQDLTYEYGRTSSGTLVYERIVIDEVVFAEIDKRKSGTATINAAGAETLNRDLSKSNISLAKYISKNAILAKHSIVNKHHDNDCFEKFMKFVDSMLYVNALNANAYIGFTMGRTNIDQSIVKNGWTEDLVVFLKECDICLELSEQSQDGEMFIGQRFGQKTVKFMDVASRGVKRLVTYFFWMKTTMASKKGASLVYVDDMDSLHHAASAPMLNLAMASGAQVLIATASTSGLVMNEARPDCCFSLKDGEIHSLLQKTKKYLRPEHNLEKLYRAGAFE